jgi:hypothetical protein
MGDQPARHLHRRLALIVGNALALGSAEDDPTIQINPSACGVPDSLERLDRAWSCACIEADQDEAGKVRSLLITPTQPIRVVSRTLLLPAESRP